ncbi:MAG: rhodanese-like domain-containing protein [Deltaproteobacteria bacterium]|nr:rhodanese-like domain-containing protein [Deltaproteobacteria bacterium]
MKKAVLFLVAALSIAVQVCAAEQNITSRDAKSLLEKNRNVYLLDVRTPQEYTQGKLAGSVLIPVGDLERRIGEIPKNRPIIVYCAVGSRSRYAAGLLSQRGYKEVYNITDGIVGWYRNGFPILK